MKYFDYQEKKQHGSFDFPIEFYNVTPKHPRYNMPYHWHTECEIIRILDGEFSLIINDENILAKKGDIIFIHDGVLHGGTPSNCTYQCIVFDIQTLSKQNNACTKLLSDLINHNKTIYTKISGYSDHIETHSNYLFDSASFKDIGYEFIAQGSLYNLLGYILKHELYTVNENKNIKRTNENLIHFKQVLSLIENNYSNLITLDDLSSACGMSSKYFCRFFFEMTNKTPIEYLNYYRIEVACEELVTTDYTITDIAFNCGFNDVSYFIKTFKKYKDITPKQYIKKFKFKI